MKIECIFFRDLQYKTEVNEFILFSSSSCCSSSFPLHCVGCLHNDERRRRWTMKEDGEKIEKQTSLHYMREHLSLSGISFNFSCSTFSSTHRIYIMMEILNLLIYFISFFYIRDFIFIDFHLCSDRIQLSFFHPLCVIFIFLDYYSTIYFFSPKVIHHIFNQYNENLLLQSSIVPQFTIIFNPSSVSEGDDVREELSSGRRRIKKLKKKKIKSNYFFLRDEIFSSFHSRSRRGSSLP